MPETTPARYTHAAGEVYARTWYEQSVQRPLTKEIRTPTGRTASKHTLLAFGGALPLHFNADSPYENYDTVETTHDLVLFGYYTGLSWKTRTYTEVTLSYEPLTPEQAMERQGRSLRPQSRRRLARALSSLQATCAIRQSTNPISSSR